MKCKQCGIQLSSGLEESLGLCPDCAFRELISKRTEDDTAPDDYTPMFKPRYWVGGLLSMAGWITLIGGTLAVIGAIITSKGFIITALCIVSTILGSAVWFGLDEIIRMLQNKAYNE